MESPFSGFPPAFPAPATDAAAPPDPARPRWGVRDMALAGGVFLLLIGLTLGGLYLTRLIFGFDREGGRPLALAATGLTELSLILVAWIFGPARFGGGWRALGFRSIVPPAVADLVRNEQNPALRGLLSLISAGLVVAGSVGTVLIAGFSITIIYGLLLRVLGLTRLSPDPVRNVIGNQSSSVLLAVFLAAVIAPLAEETFFRGFLLGGLRERFGQVPGLAISAAAFAIFHGDPRVFIPIFFLGLLLGAVRLSTGSVVPSMFAHGTYNALVLFIAYRLPVT